MSLPLLLSIVAIGALEPRCVGKGGGISQWDRARAPKNARYCALLVKAQVRRRQRPTAALKFARQAGALFPQRAAPEAITGMVLLSQGKAKKSLSHLQLAAKRAPRLGRRAEFLFSLAGAEQRTGNPEKARSLFRRLATQLNFLPRDLRLLAWRDATLAWAALGPGGVATARTLSHSGTGPVAVAGRSQALAWRSLLALLSGKEEKAKILAAQARQLGALTAVNPKGPNQAKSTRGLLWACKALMLQRKGEQERAQKAWAQAAAHFPANHPWHKLFRARRDGKSA